MTVIKKDFGMADSADHKSGGKRNIANAMRDVADDLAGIQVATIASADASDLGTAITLVNEIKGALNTNAAHALLTTKG
jgi:hypothetical protein